MAKINVQHFSVGPVYMFVIDDLGQIWKKSIDSDNWALAGEIPDAINV